MPKLESSSGAETLAHFGRQRKWLSYALAPALTAAALLIRLRVQEATPGLLILELPVLITAYGGGLGPGVLCTALAASSAAYFLLPPTHSFSITNPLDRVEFFILIA